jgi:hypothetical protein
VPPLQNWHAGAEQVPGTAPTADDLARVAEVYAKDLALFEELSGIDTSAWPTPSHPRRAARPRRAGRPAGAQGPLTRSPDIREPSRCTVETRTTAGASGDNPTVRGGEEVRARQ